MADLTMRSILPVYLLTLIVFTLLPSDAAFAQGWRPAHYTPYHAPYYAPGYSYYAPAAYPPPMYAPYPPPRYPLTPPAAMAIPMPTQPLVEQPQAAIVPPEVKADAPIETPEPAKKMPGGAQRKEAFVDRLLPHIDAENKRLRLLRKRLIGVFAAGNRAMVKMSENSRALTRLLIDITPQYFERDKLAFFEEIGGVGIEFSQLPFDHLIFTFS